MTPSTHQPAQSEDQIQAAVVMYARQTYLQYHRLIWAIPNGGARDARQGALLKSTGTLEGVWDLAILFKGIYHIIETKRPGHKLTEDRVVMERGRPHKHFGQLQWGELMAKQGAVRHVYYSVKEGCAIIDGIFGA